MAERVAAWLAASGLVFLAGLLPAHAGMVAVIRDFTIARDGAAFFNDPFSGALQPPAAPAFADGSAGSYFIGGKVAPESEVGGKLSMNSADGALGAIATGEGRRTLFLRLMSNADPKLSNKGLKSGHTFSMAAVFDLVPPGGPVEGYGIRFADAAPGKPADAVAALFVYRNEGDALVIRFLSQNFVAKSQTIIADVAIDPLQGNQVRLVLSRASLTRQDTKAQFQFLRNGAPASELQTAGTGAPIFDRANWTRGEFFVFEKTSETVGKP
jgi:hypothetical protein